MRLSNINAGVVGVGFIGTAHVEALRRLGMNVVGVVGSTPERAKAKAEAADLPDVYESVTALAADPTIDVIHIASPNYAHADQVRICLDGGKHVVCEKPLALASVDTADLVARAAASGLVNAVCFNIRFYPNCHQAKALVASGSIGKPRFVTGSYLQDWLLLDTDWNWRLVPEEAGGTSGCRRHRLALAGSCSVHQRCGRHGGDGRSPHPGAGAPSPVGPGRDVCSELR